MVKVAIFIIGQPRFLTGKSYESIKKHLIDKYDCSFYCHWWFDEKNYLPTSNWDGKQPPFKCDINTENIIKKLYNPIAYRFDKPLENKMEIINKYKQYKIPDEIPRHLIKEETPYNLMSLYKSMKLCSDLYKNDKNDKNYDFFIKLRYDSVIINYPDLNNYNYGDDVLFDYWHINQSLINIDSFICKNEQNFLSMFNIYDNFDLLCEKSYRINCEEFTWTYIKLLNIPYKNISFDIYKIKLPEYFNYDMS